MASNIVGFHSVMIIQRVSIVGNVAMEEESSFLRNAARTAMDWLLALPLAPAAAFWMLSWWRTPSLPDAAPEWTLSSLDGGDSFIV